MYGGAGSESMVAQARTPEPRRLAGFLVRQAILGAFVTVIALVHHLTGSSGSTLNISVLVLGILIAQVTIPHRQLRMLLYPLPQPSLQTLARVSPERGALAMQLTAE